MAILEGEKRVWECHHLVTVNYKLSKRHTHTHTHTRGLGGGKIKFQP